MSVSYKPPAAAIDVLGPIICLFDHPKTVEVKDALHGKKFMCEFPGGQLYFESRLEVDTDGSDLAAQDPTGAKKNAKGVSPTSVHFADGRVLDANTVNYFVLPENGFDDKHHIQDGDFAIVIRGAKKAYACYGDRGQAVNLGEGSIALLRELGHETVSRGRFINSGIDSGVITIVFPGSGNGHGQTTFQSNLKTPPLFDKLKEEALTYEHQILQRFRSRDIVYKSPVDRADLEAKLADWMQDVLDKLPHAPGSDGDGEDLVNTAEGIETLLYAPVTMALPGGKGYDTRTIYADFTMGTKPETKWYVEKVYFHLSPQDQAAAESARIRGKY